jgi:hypothetical protein
MSKETSDRGQVIRRRAKASNLALENRWRRDGRGDRARHGAQRFVELVGGCNKNNNNDEVSDLGTQSLTLAEPENHRLTLHGGEEKESQTYCAPRTVWAPGPPRNRADRRCACRPRASAAKEMKRNLKAVSRGLVVELRDEGTR